MKPAPQPVRCNTCGGAVKPKKPPATITCQCGATLLDNGNYYFRLPSGRYIQGEPGAGFTLQDPAT